MPRAFDTRAPIALWDPNRSDLNSNVQQHLDLGDLLLTGIEHLIDIILEEFGKLIGFDFTQFLTDMHQVIENLKLLFGELNPLSGEFNPIAAIGTFIELLKESLITLPMDIIEGLPIMLAGFLSDHPILNQIVSAITGVLGGGLIEIEKFFANLFNVIPVGAITGEQPNLLTAGAFPAEALHSDDPAWTLDLANTMTADGTGSLKLVCDGNTHAIRSGRDRTDYVRVSPGQTLKVSINVTSMDYAGVGADNIQLQLVPFYGPTATYAFTTHRDPITIASYSPLPGDAPDWPGVTITDSWMVTENVIGVQLRLLVTSAAQSGTLNFDNASIRQTGLIAQEHVSGLGSVIQNLIGRIQIVIDAVVNAFTGQDSFLHSMEELALALLNIPFGNILGVGGPTNIGESIMSFLDHLLGGLVGTPGSGGGLADVFNISYLVSSMASLGKFAWELLGIRNNEPVANGLLPTGDSNYPYANANTYLAVTQAASLCVTYRSAKSSPLGVVSWLGHTSTGITGFYVNVRKIDPTTGARVLVHHSPNIVANLPAGTSPNWVFYELAEPLARTVSEDYEIQLVPVGGTHYVKGYDTGDAIPDHPYAQVLATAAVRNETTPTSPTGTIAKASVTTSTKVMWIETAIDTGNATGYFDPVTVYLTEDTSIPIPKWAGYIDAIALGAGGGGRAGGTLGFYGEPGTAGKWAAVTWERGVHWDDNTDTVVQFDCGVGGSGGVALSSPAGGTGGASRIALTGHTLTAAGGTGGVNLLMGLASHYPGQGAGTYTFNSQPYVGGGAQFVYGATGASPGGGGMGGNWVNFQAGGAGGTGGGWVRFRQGAIEGGGDIPDTTPPTAPTIVLDDETFTTITVTATGAIDS